MAFKQQEISAERLVEGDTVTAWFMGGKWVKNPRPMTITGISRGRYGAGQFTLLFKGAIRDTSADEQCEILVRVKR